LAKHLLLALTAVLFSTLAAGTAIADDTTAALQSELNAFMQSPDHEYAPATAARAQALVGAALLAEDEQDATKLQAAIAEAEQTLEEARNNARLFRQKFADLLVLRAAARESLPYGTATAPGSSNDPQQLMNEAEQGMSEAVQAMESGNLGVAQQRGTATQTAFIHVIDRILPAIIDKADETLSRAASSGAKSYAPETYRKAKDALDALQHYRDGIDKRTPLHPARAVRLAEQARDTAKEIKRLRRSKGSHEELLLQARHDRLLVAESLGITVGDPELDDVGIERLNARSHELMQELQQQRQQNREIKAKLTAEFEAELQQRLGEEQAALEKQKAEQLGSMKEAFRAKLERETFEVKRQQQLKKLFTGDEANILANLDGSLLLRLSSLQFASGSTKIAPSYFELLGRVKDGLALYADRKVRIEGHTDNRGDVKLNQQLSLKRAEAVRDFLIAAGVPAGRLKALGYGEVRPIASNEFKKGRAMNRRIDIVIEAPHE